MGRKKEQQKPSKAEQTSAPKVHEDVYGGEVHTAARLAKEAPTTR